MADYWKSQDRKYCDFCKCWIADNKPSISFHEGGKKHQENVKKKLREVHKNSAKQAKLQRNQNNEIQKMEKAAMAAYLKDVEGDTRDISASEITVEKNININEYKCTSEADIDPLDPFAKQKLARLAAKQAKKKSEVSNKKSSSTDSKGRDKKQNKEKIPVIKVWYESKSKGHSYYWNIQTNESVWEPPIEGYVSLEEQAQQAHELEIQQQFYEEIEKKEKNLKEEFLKEQKANEEREKLKVHRKRFIDEEKKEGEECDTSKSSNEVIYRRDYSIPNVHKPYGSWQVVKKIQVPTTPLQLPKSVEKPIPKIVNDPPVQRVFKQKTITCLPSGDSDDEGSAVSFKKMKRSHKNIRKRLDDD